MKKAFLLLSVCVPLLLNAQSGEKVMLGGKPSVFEFRIQGRETVDPAQPAKHLTGDEQIAQWDKKRMAIEESKPKDSRFVGAMQLAEQAKGYRVGKVKERMDSVVVREGKNDPTGAPISKQEFTYDDKGRPLSCINSVINENDGSWNYYGEYGYEWNEDGHMINVWAINDPNEGTFKYEFIYGNGGAYYTNQVYYTYENEEWVPSQMAAYTVDDAGNTIEEIYSLYDADMDDWVQAERHTATYDEHGWTTSYFTYSWDANQGKWVGLNSTSANLTWEYTSTGKDAMQVQFIWDGNDWMAINRLVYTYDEAENMTQSEWQYWNFEHQDWRGGYINQNGQAMNNSKTLYYYDDQNRLVRQETYNRTADQDYTNYYTYDEITYTDLPETNEVEQVRCTYGNIGSGSIELYRRITERHKPVATAATYYLSERKLTAGTDIMIKVEEDIRFIDDNGYYHGLETYSFTPNETNFRQGSSKEQITYDDQMRQTGNHHWRGRRTGATTWQWDDYDDWVVLNVEGYDGNVVAGYDLYSYAGTTKYPDYGFYTTFDFTMRPENMVKWSSNSYNENFRKYKYLETYNYINQGGATNVDIYEYTNIYYYSEIGKLQGGWNEDGTPIVLATQNADKLRATQAPNGEIYVGWTSSAGSGYQGNVQLVDVEGYTMLGENGTLLNTQAISGYSAMMGMATDANSNLLVSFPDSRNQSSKWNTMPYVYSLSNATGIAQWNYAIPAADETANVTHDIISMGDNYYVTFYDSNDYSNHTFYVNRINADGQIAWEESKAMPGAFATFLPSGENILMVYCENNKVYSQLLNGDFESLRGVNEISGSVQVTSLPYTGNLFNCQSDGNGGMVVVFADASYNAKYYMQHIDATGAPTLTDPYLINPDGNIENVEYCVDANHQRLGVFYQTGDWNGHQLNMQVVNLDGTTLLAGQPITDMSNSYTVSGAKVVDNEFVVAYVNTINYSTNEQYIVRINIHDGKVRGLKVGDNAVPTATDAIINDDAAYYFWASTMIDYSTYEVTNEIQGVRYMLSDLNDVIYELSTTGIADVIASETQKDGKAYDIMGRQVNPETARGIIIIDGKKIIK